MKRIEQLKNKIWGDKRLKIFKEVEMMDMNHSKSSSSSHPSLVSISPVFSKVDGHQVGDNGASSDLKNVKIGTFTCQPAKSSFLPISIPRRGKRGGGGGGGGEGSNDQEKLLRSDYSTDSGHQRQQNPPEENRKKYQIVPRFLTLHVSKFRSPRQQQQQQLPTIFSQRSQEGGGGENNNSSLFRSDPVYKETTEEFFPPDSFPTNSACCEGDNEDDDDDEVEGDMARYREEMSEVHPLRGNEEWSSTGGGGGGDVRTGIFQGHRKTLHWALFFAVMALSVLIFFSVLAVVLEMRSKVSSNSPASEQEMPPLLKLDDMDDMVHFVPHHVPRASTLNDFQLLTKRLWPLEDVATRDLNEFKSKFLQTNDQSSQPGQGPGKGKRGKLKSSIMAPDAKVANERVILEGLKAAMEAKADREQTETQLVKLGMLIKSTSPFGRFCVAARKTTDEARRRGATGFLVDRASQNIAQKLNMSKEEAQQGIPWDVKGSLQDYLPNEFCTNDLVTLDSCNRSHVYRSYDGSCNNLHRTSWGASNEPYRRVLVPDYADGISLPRVASDGKSSLPNPRLLTTTILKSDPTDDPVATFMLVLWGQFVDHDIAYTAPSTGFNGTAIACCSDGKLLNIQHEECYPFTMSEEDEFYNSVGQHCTNFVRSAPSPLCHLGPREQFNQITSFLDASTLYGSSTAEAAQVLGRLETAEPGRLPLSWWEDGRPLPQRSVDLDDGCNTLEDVEKRKFCFRSGDKRINEYIGITTLNLLWARQHNEIAEHLISVNPHWMDRDKIFQESRRIVIAQIQHITYNEFLPLLLGPAMTKAAGLQLLPTGYYEGYDQEVNPTISNVFAGAAFRMGHSMIQGLVKMIGPRWKNEEFIQIHKLFFNPLRLYELGGMDEILRGHIDSPAGKADLHFSKQVTEHLFQLRNNTYGLDLAAIDIQRGRDHGLPGYVTWRSICGLSEVKDFTDLTGIWSIESVQAVQKMYKSIQDIDLYIGGLAEIPLQDAMVGPVFACLLSDQFNRLRKGDRFWYEEGQIQLKPFTPAQLQMIRKTTLAHILCVNSDDVESLQGRVMEKISPTTNPRVPCRTIPELDYHPWKEESTPTPKSEAGSSGSHHILKSILVQQQGGNDMVDSLEELYEEDEEEERFEAEKEKDKNHFRSMDNNNSSSNRTQYPMKPAPSSSFDDDLDDVLFNSSLRKQFTKNKIILQYPTPQPSPLYPSSTPSTWANLPGHGQEVKTSNKNDGHHSSQSDLKFHQTKDGIIMEWRSRRSDPEVAKNSDKNNSPETLLHEYEDF